MNRCTIILMRIGLLFALLFSGCINQKAVLRDTFLLDAPRPGVSGQPASETILAVQLFSIGPAYQSKGLVYRTGENKYKSDFYNEYFISPASMLTEQARNWLSASGVFAQVLSPASSVAPTHILEGHVRQIGADLRDDSKPRATLEISFFLLKQQKRNRTIQLNKTYSVTRPLADETAAACIDALNQCLSEILGNLEKDLASNL